MKSKTQDLQTLWWDWLGTAERLQRSLHEQTAALTLRDVARIERIQPEVEAFMERMREIDDRAAASARKLADEFGCEPNLRSLVDVLDNAEAQQVQALANRVIVAGRNVQAVIEKNRRLIDSELEYVSGTLALIARSSGDQQGPYQPKSQEACVIMNQVA